MPVNGEGLETPKLGLKYEDRFTVTFLKPTVRFKTTLPKWSSEYEPMAGSEYERAASSDSNSEMTKNQKMTKKNWKIAKKSKTIMGASFDRFFGLFHITSIKTIPITTHFSSQLSTTDFAQISQKKYAKNYSFKISGSESELAARSYSEPAIGSYSELHF